MVELTWMLGGLSKVIAGLHLKGPLKRVGTR